MSSLGPTSLSCLYPMFLFPLQQKSSKELSNSLFPIPPFPFSLKAGIATFSSWTAFFLWLLEHYSLCFPLLAGTPSQPVWLSPPLPMLLYLPSFSSFQCWLYPGLSPKTSPPSRCKTLKITTRCKRTHFYLQSVHLP